MIPSWNDVWKLVVHIILTYNFAGFLNTMLPSAHSSIVCTALDGMAMMHHKQLFNRADDDAQTNLSCNTFVTNHE